MDRHRHGAQWSYARASCGYVTIFRQSSAASMAYSIGNTTVRINREDEFVDGNFFVSKWQARALTESPDWKISSDIATAVVKKFVFLS